MTLTKLNQRFSAVKQVRFFEDEHGLLMAEIKNKQAICVVSLYGAHVLSYIPAGEKDLLWMSPKSMFEVGKPIRGGIPVCFPWFGPHVSNSALPQHGFARLMYWEVDKVVNNDEKECTEIFLKIADNEFTRQFWPHQFVATIRVIVGKCLDLRLKVENTSNEPIVITEALHTYLNISGTQNIRIAGLANTAYYDGLQNNALKQQEAEILTIAQEENRRYINHSAMCAMSDTGFGRKVGIAKKNSQTTVVWNPWAETSKTMGDLPLDGYKTFVCIEAVNAYDNEMTIPAGQSHEMATMLCTQAIEN
jgi:glucose-6-phosphate 1-epimerase